MQNSSCLIRNAYLFSKCWELPERHHANTLCCEIICQKDLLEERVHFLGCGHIFHSKCLNRLLKDGFFAIYQGKSVDHIRCPASGCDQPIAFDPNFIKIAADKYNQEIFNKGFSDLTMSKNEQQMLQEFKKICFPDYAIREVDRKACRVLLLCVMGYVLVMVLQFYRSPNFEAS